MSKCNDCIYLNGKDSTGYVFTKYFCTKIQQYISSETPACALFVERQYGGCYLTTACVKYMGLEDNCYELTTLRAFRDEYVAKQEQGDLLIKRYYDTAPRIVDAINNSKDCEAAYNEIYDYIRKCVRHIENKEYEITLRLYVDMVEKMSAKYL